MAKELKVAANQRAKAGTADSRRLRLTGMVPAVLYNDKAESSPIQVNAHAFDMTLRGHATATLLMTMDLDGAEKKVLVREVQRHPVSNALLHVDFIEVSLTKKMRVDLPVRLTGDPVGVTLGNGVLQHLLREVTVDCLPADLVEELLVDVTALEVGDSLSAGELTLPAGLTLVTQKDVAVATVTEQKEEEAATPAEGEAAAAEPELVAKKKEGEEAAPAEGAEKKAAPAKEKEKK